MNRTAMKSLLTVAMVGVALAGCVPGEIGGTDDRDRTESYFTNLPQYPHMRLCTEATEPGIMACHGRVVVDANGKVSPLASPKGLTPVQLQSAYNLDTSGGAGATIAIVDAYDDPNAEKDLGTYRSTFGLPACTTANGCFKKVNQNGTAGSYPKADQGWAVEIMLDLDMASAACPNCKILLVEANSDYLSDLGSAENTAASLGATVISNSYGGYEDSSDPWSDSQYFNHPGVGIFVSSGDSGYGAQYPASSPYVTAVGGTSLAQASGTARGWAETAWNGTGSGCSGFESKPSWQKDTGCAKRTVGDVSAVANPNTGAAVYDSYGKGGWIQVGGTSLASPLVAAIFALTGKGGAGPSFSYSNLTAFYDVTSGSNGSCGSSYLCTAKAGYDGPTGNGTPNGAALAGSSGGGGGGCTPGCSGKNCGSDGCGGTCGTCASGQTCSSSGVCTTAGGGGTCSHSICSTGIKLVSGCDPCATKICAADSYCCSTAWDSICEGEVASVCGQSCSGGGTGGGGGGTGGGSTCSHPICSTGTKLTSSCDPCATEICAADSYCCNIKWDSICVGEVASICGETC
jgi:hypothetical protein